MQTIIRDYETIKNFLLGITPDYKGRMYQDIINCDDIVMEQCHDQVQWMFPLHEESNYAITYPIIDKGFKDSLSIQDKYTIWNNLNEATKRMENFYGFNGTPEYQKTRQVEWCVNGDHNLLRITRIIRCLRLFNCSDTAKNFYKHVIEIGIKNGIDIRTLQYWQKAAQDNIWNSLK